MRTLTTAAPSDVNKPVIPSPIDGEVVPQISTKSPTGRIILSEASKIKFNPSCAGTESLFVCGMSNVKSNGLN